MVATDQYQLDHRFRADEGTVFLTGIQALARLTLEQLRADRRAGLNTAAFISGYQGLPLGGYGEAVARAARLESDLPIVFKQGMNGLCPTYIPRRWSSNWLAGPAKLGWIVPII